MGWLEGADRTASRRRAGPGGARRPRGPRQGTRRPVPYAGETDASLQIYCVSTIYLDRDVMGTAPSAGLTLNACLLRPRSRGRVSLRSADPRDLPRVETGYLRGPADLGDILRGLRLCREIHATRPLADQLAEEILPGPDATSDEALADHVRRTVKTNYHPCGTVRLGREGDPRASLSPDGAVKGVGGLWVLDASAMPTIISGNTNAPTMALADRLLARAFWVARPRPRRPRGPRLRPDGLASTGRTCP